MPTVAALFGTEQEAEEALDKLYELGFADDDIQVIYGADGGVEGLGDTLRDLDIPRDEAQFFARTVAHSGAALVVVQTEDDETAEVRQLLHEVGGRTEGD